VDFDLAYDDDWCPQERNVLKQFYEVSVGRRWLNNTGWGGQYNNHCTTWHGITCNRDGYVTHINLADNSLSGFIAEEIGLLQHLKELDVTQNRLGGTVPTEVGMLLHLTNLVLSDNRLTGSLPKELSILSELQTLDLSRNTLQGGISFLPGNATSLQFLDVGANRLRGDMYQVLEPLLKLKNITEIDLTRNEFTGVVPANASVSGLDVLSLSGNR
jgi:Leucine-rich repeat (LRR) protein